MDQKVSIIIPTFNRSGTLLRAIDSSLNQTYQNSEVIVVDDGSSDGSSVIMANYAHYKNFCYIKVKKNEGTAQAKNIGILLSRGDAITFHDSDDEALPTKVAEQIKRLSKKVDNVSYVDSLTIANNISPSVDVVFTKCLIIRKESVLETGNISFLVAQAFPNIVYPNFEKEKLFIHTNSALYHKSVFSNLGGFMNTKVMEDTEMQNRLLYAGKNVYLVEEALYKYSRGEATSLTDNKETNDSSQGRLELAKEIYGRVTSMKKNFTTKEFQVKMNLEECKIEFISNPRMLQIDSTIPATPKTYEKMGFYLKNLAKQSY